MHRMRLIAGIQEGKPITATSPHFKGRNVRKTLTVNGPAVKRTMRARNLLKAHWKGLIWNHTGSAHAEFRICPVIHFRLLPLGGTAATRVLDGKPKTLRPLLFAGGTEYPYSRRLHLHYRIDTLSNCKR